MNTFTHTCVSRRTLFWMLCLTSVAVTLIICHHSMPHSDITSTVVTLYASLAWKQDPTDVESTVSVPAEQFADATIAWYTQWTYTTCVYSGVEMNFSVIGSHPDDLHENVLKVNSIEISRRGEATPFQVIEHLDVIMPSDGLLTEDMNFDGYQDFRVVKFGYPGPNIKYAFWLFDPNTERFIRNIEMESLVSPSFDHEQGLIRTFCRINAAEYEIGYYKFAGIDLVLSRRELREYIDETRYKLTIWERINEEMVITEQTIVEGE